MINDTWWEKFKKTHEKEIREGKISSEAWISGAKDGFDFAMSQDDGLLGFLDFLNKIYIKGEVCVFYNLAGHVNWLEYDIAFSKKDYTDKIASGTIKLDPKYYEKDSIFYNQKTLKETLEWHKEHITEAIKNKLSEKQRMDTERTEREKATLRKLKEKYPND